MSRCPLTKACDAAGIKYDDVQTAGGLFRTLLTKLRNYAGKRKGIAAKVKRNVETRPLLGGSETFRFKDNYGFLDYWILAKGATIG